MIVVLFSGPVPGALLPAAFADPTAMAVGLVVLLGIFVWLKVTD